MDETDTARNGLYRIGGAAALIRALAYLVALGVYVPAVRADPPPASALEWIRLFRCDPLTGLFFLGLADIAIMILWGPMSLALCAAFRQFSKSWSLIATTFVFVGMAVYLATNTAFSMLALSRQYAAATTEAEIHRPRRRAGHARHQRGHRRPICGHASGLAGRSDPLGCHAPQQGLP